MANPFESFIQVELPKRPFLENNVEEETIIIRRGAGPLQLSAIKLQNGEILGMVDGKLAAVPAHRGVEIGAAVHIQEEPQYQWMITHNRNNKNVVVTMYNSSGVRFEADVVEVSDNYVKLTMNTAVAGRAVLLFVPTPSVD